MSVELKLDKRGKYGLLYNNHDTMFVNAEVVFFVKDYKSFEDGLNHVNDFISECNKPKFCSKDCKYNVGLEKDKYNRSVCVNPNKTGDGIYCTARDNCDYFIKGY